MKIKFILITYSIFYNFYFIPQLLGKQTNEDDTKKQMKRKYYGPDNPFKKSLIANEMRVKTARALKKKMNFEFIGTGSSTINEITIEKHKNVEKNKDGELYFCQF